MSLYKKILQRLVIDGQFFGKRRQVKAFIILEHCVGKHRKCAELRIAEIIFEIFAEPVYNTDFYV